MFIVLYEKFLHKIALNINSVKRLAAPKHLLQLFARVLQERSVCDNVPLFQFPYISKLETLDLSDSDLTDLSAIAIANSDQLSRLLTLNLSGNRITDEGAKALAGSEHLAQLKKLDLNFNSIGDAGAQAIAVSSYMTNIESLKLGQNRVGAVGAKALKNSSTLVNLMHPIFGFY